ncbi:hypothetical protein [Candidatus Nanopelagicus hibericus]|uniref:hypothetical protein n=1 Tax=Candidatus Nanopelagicus hibericus TaxID=1884915 RepID=UPI001CBC18CC|nr:hypothetical protein [Candidatus Nanopelagicus hibericus]
MLLGIFAYIPLLAVKPTGGHSGKGDGIGVAVFFTFFLVGFLLGFFEGVVVWEVFGVAVADFVAAGLVVEVGLGLTFGEGVAPYADVIDTETEISMAIINFMFTPYSI